MLQPVERLGHQLPLQALLALLRQTPGTTALQNAAPRCRQRPQSSLTSFAFDCRFSTLDVLSGAESGRPTGGKPAATKSPRIPAGTSPGSGFLIRDTFFDSDFAGLCRISYLT